MLSSGETSVNARKRPERAVIAAVAAGLVAALVLAVNASAGPAPSATIILNCDRGVPYQYNPGEGVAGIDLITFYRGPNGTVRAVGAADPIECPTANGGRVRVKVTLSAPAASVSVRCWNGTIGVGDTTGNLPLTGDCVDNTTPGVGHYATYQISGRPAAATDAQSLCREIGGTFSTDPGSDVTGYYPGARVVWTCNDWPETYIPEYSLWQGYCTADGGDSMGFTSNRPTGGARRGITCFDAIP